MKDRIAIVAGHRTPFCKAGGVLRSMGADDLGAVVARELLAAVPAAARDIDELIAGNVAQPGHAANIARVIALKAGLPQDMPAFTVHRNCASGMEAITTAMYKIMAGEAKAILCVGTENMSQIPLLWNQPATRWFESLAKAKGMGARIGSMLKFRPRFLKPVIGLLQGLTDPVCSLNMGQTAEVLAQDFSISRDRQDAYALQSHQRAAAAVKAGFFSDEIMPLPVAPDFKHVQQADDCIRAEQSLQALAKLRPVFDKQSGTVTAGNACPITDGACAVLIMTEARAKELELPILGIIEDACYAGLDGKRMGLGPVHATAKLLQRTGRSMQDFERIELNEAFAVQVLACQEAFASSSYAQQHFNRDTAVGAIDPEILNVNGGAIALGHPVGSTGMRLVITLLRQLHADGLHRGLATLCIGGGQGAAFSLEVPA